VFWHLCGLFPFQIALAPLVVGYVKPRSHIGLPTARATPPKYSHFIRPRWIYLISLYSISWIRILPTLGHTAHRWHLNRKPIPSAFLWDRNILPASLDYQPIFLLLFRACLPKPGAMIPLVLEVTLCLVLGNMMAKADRFGLVRRADVQKPATPYSVP
jgi:hypothetical protein